MNSEVPGEPGEPVAPDGATAHGDPRGSSIEDFANRQVSLLLDAVPRDELEVEPGEGPVDFVVRPPGSKSITNRALVCAALAEGTTTISGVLFADDTVAMISCLASLGIRIRPGEGADELVVHGVGGADGVAVSSGPESVARLDAKLSGTTARFIAPVAAIVADRAVLDGEEPLRRRPMGELVAAMRTLGARIDSTGSADGLPLEIDGSGFRGGTVDVSADVSSQFLSALLLSGPAMGDGLEVTLRTGMVSAPYVEMTIAVMAAFGAVISRDERGIRVAPGGYRSPGRYIVEPDASAASYFLGAAAIRGGRTRIEGLGRSSLQGDIRLVDVLAQMGMVATWSDDAVEVAAGAGLRGVEVDMADISDVAQTLAVVATTAQGPTRVSGIGFIRAKETDRISAVVTELNRLGIEAREEPDGFVIHPGEPAPGLVQTYDDHRMAMSFALLGLRYPGIRIADPHCVAKTYPGFWHDLGQVRDISEETGHMRVIAIDGPAGSGKSTIGRALADRLGLTYLDTGAMYRGVAFAALRAGLDVTDDDSVGRLAKETLISVEDGHVNVDGVDATTEIRGAEVSAAVSTVAALPSVREELRGRQRKWATEHGGGVIEGRDIGSVVFPDAVLKVYLTASPEVRAARRAVQIGDSDMRAVAEALARRDSADSTRRDSPLVEPDGAVTIDSSELGIEQVVELIVTLVEERSR